jgi:hypothetical protein
LAREELTQRRIEGREKTRTKNLRQTNLWSERC